MFKVEMKGTDRLCTNVFILLKSNSHRHYHCHHHRHHANTHHCIEVIIRQSVYCKIILIQSTLSKMDSPLETALTISFREVSGLWSVGIQQ